MIREKFFEAKYRERLTGNDVLAQTLSGTGRRSQRPRRRSSSAARRGSIRPRRRAWQPGHADRRNETSRRTSTFTRPEPRVTSPFGLSSIRFPISSFARRYPRAKSSTFRRSRKKCRSSRAPSRINQDLKVNSMATFSGALARTAKRSRSRASSNTRPATTRSAFFRRPFRLPGPCSCAARPATRARGHSP